ncbi:MAG: 50S ribosomal protein L29 [Candidatus Marinimicrobia bacterium]|nr:50S ribosomal protein L29 [Candidatus Neomarinimicrobiota bacterium]|tara:strand:+ start:20221 stop:20424 length:204 start_codon:yes stop_codon:yes gene_type:complete
MAKEKNLKDLSLDELNKKLMELNDSMLNYRFQKTLQQLEDPKQINQNRKDIARVKTFIKQFELGLKK